MWIYKPLLCFVWIKEWSRCLRQSQMFFVVFWYLQCLAINSMATVLQILLFRECVHTMPHAISIIPSVIWHHSAFQTQRHSLLMIHTHPCFLNKLYTVETGQGDLYLAKSRNTNNLQLVKPEDALVAKTRNDKNILLIPKRTDRKIKTKEPAIKKKSSYVPEPTITNKVECLGKNCYLKKLLTCT